MTSRQVKIPATYMRGGTSKGVFFNVADLPVAMQSAGKVRDQALLRIIGSPDVYTKQIDGMGGATSSTSKIVLIEKSKNAECDIDYMFGQVSIDQAFIDWSGNCGNLTAAVGAFAIHQGLVDAKKIPQNGICSVKIWQKNISKILIVNVPIENGEVQELGDFVLDGVAFPAGEIVVEFLDDIEESEAILPTGNVVDTLDVPDIGSLQVSFINAGIPTVFVNATDIGYTGTELQDHINNDELALAKFEKIRAYAAVKMGLIKDVSEAKQRQHTPKIAFVSAAQDYTDSSGKVVESSQIDLCVRALSMGKLHHAMMGTAAVAIGVASVIDGTLVNLASGGGARESVTFGHPSGRLKVGAEVVLHNGVWKMKKALMSRSARRLMEGGVYLPETFLV